MSVETRQSNFEALRIVAMSVIVLLHYFGLSFRGTLPDYDLGLFVRPFVRWGVDIFFMISGWFLIRTTLRGLTRIVVYTLFYVITAYIALSFTPIGFAAIWQQFLSVFIAPLSTYDYWFIQVYFALMLVAPIVNAGLKKLSLVQFNAIVVCISVMGVYGGFFFENCLTMDGMGFFQGFWMYLVGRCLRLNKDIFDKIPKQAFVGIWFIMLTVCGILFIYTHYWPLEDNYSPFIVVASISLFLYFSKLEIKRNLVINRIAACSLSCYLFHISPLFDMYVYGWIGNLYGEVAEGRSILFSIGFVAVSAVVFLVVSWVAAILLTPVANRLSNCAMKGLTRLLRRWNLSLDF